MKSFVPLLFVFALLLPLLVTSCGDDADAPPDASQPDAGTTPTSKTKLARPALARPPHGGLPAELRPPR
jgi:hypothetical protein